MVFENAIRNRYDFTILYDVENGNPNGDPDLDNMPRMDAETGVGIVTDVCLKRKIRDYVLATQNDQAPYRIYIQRGHTLNSLDGEAIDHLAQANGNAKSTAQAILKDAKKKPEWDQEIRNYMCGQFFDIRAFGAVMTTFVKGGLSSGQVRGPIQLGFSRSIDPISPQEITITREAITTEQDAEKKNNEMGHKYVVPYGLYRANGYISANLAQRVTGFSEDDLALLWKAILNMFELDRSASHGNMAVRRLYVFKHASEFGDTQSYKLFDSIHVQRKEGIASPRSFSDYDVSLDLSQIPSSVEVGEKIEGTSQKGEKKD